MKNKRSREKPEIIEILSQTDSETSDESEIIEEEPILKRNDKKISRNSSETTESEELELETNEKNQTDDEKKHEESEESKFSEKENDEKFSYSDITEEQKQLEKITSVADNKAQCKEYFITYNDFSEEKLKKFKDFVQGDDVVTCYMCKERAPTTNHLHFHCYILFTKRKWRKNLNSLFHGDYRRIISTPAHCFRYISKEGDIVISKNIHWLQELDSELRELQLANPEAVIRGNWLKGKYKLLLKTNNKGEKTKHSLMLKAGERQTAAKDFIEYVEQHSLAEIKVQYPVDYKMRLNTIIKMKAEYEKNLSFKPYPFSLKQKNYWLWGSAGTSKTSYATEGIHEFIGNFKPEMVYMKAFNSRWFDGYNPEVHKCIVIDDITKQITQEQTGLLKLILDRNPFHAEVKGSTINLIPNNFIVIITSNYRIEDIFQNVEDQEAIERRCNIFHCVSIGDMINKIYTDGILSTSIPPPPHLCRLLGNEEILNTPVYNGLKDPQWHDSTNREFLFDKIDKMTISARWKERYPTGILLSNDKLNVTLKQLYIPEKNKLLILIDDETFFTKEELEREEYRIKLNEYLSDETMILDYQTRNKLYEYFKEEITPVYLQREHDELVRKIKNKKEEESKEDIKEPITISDSEEDYNDSILSSDNEETNNEKEENFEEEDVLEKYPMLKYFCRGNKMQLKNIKKITIDKIKNSLRRNNLHVEMQNILDYYIYISSIYSYSISIDDISIIYSMLNINGFIEFEPFIKFYKTEICLIEPLREKHNSLCEMIISNELFSFYDGRTLIDIAKLITDIGPDKFLLSIVNKRGIVLKAIKKISKELAKRDITLKDYDDKEEQARSWNEAKKQKFLETLN